MSLEFFKVVALLCQINAGDHYTFVINDVQLGCQKYYVQCYMEETSTVETERLKRCILKKRLIKDKKS